LLCGYHPRQEARLFAICRPPQHVRGKLGTVASRFINEIPGKLMITQYYGDTQICFFRGRLYVGDRYAGRSSRSSENPVLSRKKLSDLASVKPETRPPNRP